MQINSFPGVLSQGEPCPVVAGPWGGSNTGVVPCQIGPAYKRELERIARSIAEFEEVDP